MNDHHYMKKLVFVVLTLLHLNCAIGQTFSEWFKQKKTQKKYLVEQIGAFKVYLEYLKKGYSIAEKGLKTIRQIKGGDLNLHKEYLASFKNLNPAIKGYSKLAGIFSYNGGIIRTYSQTIKYVQTSGTYSPAEINLIGKVFGNILYSCSNDIDNFLEVITADEFEMKDDERMKRIDTVYEALEEKYVVAKRFRDETVALGTLRKKEIRNIEISRKWHGLKK
jgi:hypothetical protein